MDIDQLVRQLGLNYGVRHKSSDNDIVVPDSHLRQRREVIAAFAASLRKSGFRGEVTDDIGPRVALATDNSVYQLYPELVLFPRDAADLNRLSAVAAQSEFRAIRFAPRGGGTGTNGQSLSEAVVVDTSRHMNRILEIDVVNRRVRVEPGVVLAQLNAALAEHGLFFPPHTSTASRATIGGMIGTDACGKGSRRYGRTGDYVESVRLMLPDGRAMTLGTVPAADLADPGSLEERLARDLRDLVAPHRPAILERFPNMHRSLTGYNLRDAFPESGDVHLARLVAGAEGTLGFVAEAWLRVVERPAHQALVVVRYRDFDAALRDANRLLAAEPTAVETIDQRIIELARHDTIWPLIRDALVGERDAEPALVANFLEFQDSDPAALEARVSAFTASLDARSDHAGYHLTRDKGQIGRLWGVRAKSVGMLGRAPGRRKPVPFVEDTVVPPEHLADYIRDFTALLRRHGVDYAMFGHVDVGCLHVRPALDLTDPADAVLLRTLTDEVVALVQRYRGLLWGEHGKGMRGEYTREFFGDELYSLLASVKRQFDPDNRMNPGKIVAPSGDPTAIYRIDNVPLRGERDRQVPAAVRDQWHKAFTCNGNGACFDWERVQTICPSYKITRDRVHSPKGRAMLLREWVRQSEIAPGTGDDVANATYEALMGCLGCRACATQCPVHVNIPAMRTRFLEAYHRTHRRRVRDYLLAGLEHALPAMARAPNLSNRLLNSRLGRRAVRRLGLTAMPALPASARVLPDVGIRPKNDEELLAVCRAAERPVAVIPDAFNLYLDPKVLDATLRLIAAGDGTPVVMPYRPSGKALHVQGFASRFAGTARANARRFERVAEQGVPLVAVDPAVTVALNADYDEAINTRGYHVQALSEWLVTQTEQWSAVVGDRTPAYRLALHCTESTARPASAGEWCEIFAAAGLEVEIVRAGCCGMAGSYGHLLEHQENSRGLFDMSWRPLFNEDDRPLLATGYSCRSQSERFAGQRPAHPVEVLVAHLGR